MSIKKRILDRELTIGSWVSFAYSATCEQMAKNKFDWLVIDMEHTGIDFSASENLIRIIELAGCVPLVRLPYNDANIIKKIMDIGAHGILVPMVMNRVDAERAVDAVYYPPRGSRGVGLYRAQQYGRGFDEYKEWASSEPIVIVQIEHITAVENIEEILSVEGVDGFIIGPYDLSGSLNLPGQFKHPSVLEALSRLEEILQKSEKVGGYHVVQPELSELGNKIEQGYRFIAYGADMIFFSQELSKVQASLNKIKEEKS